MTTPTTMSREDIQNILGEDGYNLGAFQFSDNKMRFAFTVEELDKKVDKIMSLLTSRDNEWREKIKSMKFPRFPLGNSGYYGYNKALSDLLEQMEDKK